MKGVGVQVGEGVGATLGASVGAGVGVKVVVTGGAGFIGANLCRALAGDRRIEQVVALDDLSSGSAANLAGVDVRLVEGTVLDAGLLDRTFAGADAVVHLAARPSVPQSLSEPLASHLANATGTVEVLEAARRAGNLHVVVASSSALYGADPTLPKSENLPPEPVSPYAASKLAAEGYALAYQRSFGLPVLALRFFNVFGPLQSPGHAYAAVIPAFVDAALRGEPLPLYGDGGQTRDFTFVDTVTDVIGTAVAGRICSPGPVNLAYGTRTDLREVVRVLGEVLGRTLAVAHLPERPGDVRHSQADTAVLRRLFPAVEPVELREGLLRTVEWFRSRPRLVTDE